ncbi:MAG TPA: hypothetical protein VGM62_03400 [Chthoniobacterales bacterium]
MRYICLLISMAFLAACEQKDTTVTNPPGDKKTDTTVIEKSSPAESKTESSTTVNTAPGTSTSTTTTTSPSP